MTMLARSAHHLWTSGAWWAGTARALLLPAAGLYRGAVLMRNAAYDGGLRAAARLPLPSVGVGNLVAGGSGKTPVSAFVASELERRGARAAVILRGYGGDEAEEHREIAGRLVETDPDRFRAAERAAARGASVLVLDDCLQHRRVAVDVMLALVSADGWSAIRFPLPAGPWREGLGALRRADLVIVTRKAAGAAPAAALADRLAPLARTGRSAVAELAPAELRDLTSGAPSPPESLRGRRVVAACGIGQPEAFAAQLTALGADVELVAFGDHHAYGPGDAEALARRAGPAGVVVTTAKDGVKLRGLWPTGAPPCLVAMLAVQITSGAGDLGALLDRVAAAARDLQPGRPGRPGAIR